MRDVVVMLLASSVLAYWSVPPAPAAPAPPPPRLTLSVPVEKVAGPVLQALPSALSGQSLVHGVALTNVEEWLSPGYPGRYKPLPGTAYLHFGR